ncbi:MAG: ATPase domain-containing protein, partial [Tepidisphaeraceae bacterium]
ALDVLLRIFGDPRRERNELYRIHEWLIDRGLTNVLTAKTQRDGDMPSQNEFLDFMADCVLRLDHRVIGQVATRRLRVIKYRGSGFGTNEYPYVIGDHGIILFPLTKAELAHQPLGPKVSSGLDGLDTMLDGGYRSTSCILISGVSGTGKTTMACMFVQAACRRGERVLYLSFEESKEAMVTAMLSAGIDLRPPLRSGKLLVQTALPESMGSDDHLIRALRTIDTFKPDHLTIDAVSACVRMGSDQAAFDYLMRLVSIIKERGITCVMTNQISGLTGIDEELSGIGFSSVVDAVIQLRFVETDREVTRQLLIVKSRGSAHSSRRVPFVITDRGIEFPENPQPPAIEARRFIRKGGGK